MKVKIPYGNKNIELKLPDRDAVKIASPAIIPVKDEENKIKKSLDNPEGSISFGRWVKKFDHFLFVVNDATRPTPTFQILKELEKKMNLEGEKFIIATGSHKSPNEVDLKLIFGKIYDKIKNNITIHNARDKKNLVKIGITNRGTEVLINKEVIEAGAIISIGSVEPHYFAGFTGGRKSLFPGLAGYITIEQNHKLAMGKGAQPLSLEGNPVHLDLIEAFDKMPSIPIFSIQTVVKNENYLCAVFCGDIKESFLKASEYSREIFCIKIKEKADIVITVAKPPLDKNLYQAHKAIEHGKFALKNDGILILVAPCEEGIGPDNFYRLLSSSKDAKKILEIAKDDYHLGYHKAARIAELSKKSEIWIVSELKNIILKDKFIKPFSSLREAVKKAIDKREKDAKILILMDGGNTVPKLN